MSGRIAITKEKRDKEVSPTFSRSRSWIQLLSLTPSSLLPLLPAGTTCPVCIGAFAGLLSAVGLGFLSRKRVLAPLIALFLAINIASVAWSSRSHRRFAPPILALLGAAAVVAGRLVWHIHLLMYSGVALLLGASLFNLWLKRPRPDRLVQIGHAPNE